MNVWVAIYEMRHGNQVSVFKTFDGAEAWRQEIANMRWEEEFPDMPKPDDPETCADQYFDHVRDEYFTSDECEVQP